MPPNNPPVVEAQAHHPNNKPNALQKINPMMWRQSRTVKKAVASVDELVEDMTKGAPFLAEAKPNPNIAVVRRPEITTGKLLGEGSFCQVYEITNANVTDGEGLSNEEIAVRQEMQDAMKQDRNAKDPPRYAIKLPKRELLRKTFDFGKVIADLVVEALYLSRLSHPNILALRGMPVGGTDSFDSGRFDSYFLVLDRLTDSLDQRIERWQREGPADSARVPRKTNYALQVANALLYLHKRRIIFRDLKPENVGFLGEHTVQLFDFGLAREIPQGFDNQVYTMSGSGSQWYMAVEIFLTGKYNLKADVFSWAITTYEMLTETKPFAKMHTLQHVSMVCVQGKRPRLSHHKFPPGLESIIRAAWGQTVSKRPNIQEIVRKLEKLIPELGDEAACVWPTVAPDADDVAGDNNAHHDDDDDHDDYNSLEEFLLGSDGAIDDEIRKEAKSSAVTLSDVDDNDFSLSSIMFEEH